MDLWIRTQDKKRLLKINVLGYVEYQNVNVINGYFTNEVDNYDLGIYNSKERALEVLDEIQDILIDYAKISRVVYQMPEE